MCPPPSPPHLRLRGGHHREQNPGHNSVLPVRSCENSKHPYKAVRRRPSRWAYSTLEAELLQSRGEGYGSKKKPVHSPQQGSAGR